ncbi:MAG: hypothetical protein IT381_16420 [Deltaproteobacteria bacterium]|nr:hypothetical protein [Deltaproteobacteria bacterium]
MICFWCAVLPVLCGCSQGGPSLSVARLTPFERPCVETTAGACTLLADRLDCTLGALAALATVTVSADVTAPAPIDAALVGSVRGKELDANTSDNTTTVALKIVTEAQGVGSVATPDGTDSSTTPVNLKTSSTKPAGCHAQGGDPALLWLAAFVLLVLRRKRR